MCCGDFRNIGDGFCDFLRGQLCLSRCAANASEEEPDHEQYETGEEKSGNPKRICPAVGGEEPPEHDGPNHDERAAGDVEECRRECSRESVENRHN